MRPTFSIIIPVFNSEKYLAECINSIVAQDFSKWEIILVNDGSIDSSLKIGLAYQSMDKRIKVINKPNTGVSDTRNRGLSKAVGDYIIFLDADDYWLSNTILTKFNEAIQVFKPDIIRGDYCTVPNPSPSVSKGSNILYANKIISSYELLENVIGREFFSWLFVIKKKIVGNKKFNINRVFLEDLEFFSKILCNEYRCLYIPLIFYGYRKHPYSISSRCVEKKLEDAFEIANHFFSLANKTNSKDLQSSFRRRAITYFILTSKTLGEFSKFYTNRYELCKKYNLEGLREMCRRHKHYSEKWYYPLLLMLKPIHHINFWHYYLNARNKFLTIISKK